ncbi:11818_t:CDS:2 [Entrophospora sp. SA101]|nr:11818_t:CDS:2 [Entrophospora sp. SA101]
MFWYLHRSTVIAVGVDADENPTPRLLLALITCIPIISMIEKILKTEVSAVIQIIAQLSKNRVGFDVEFCNNWGVGATTWHIALIIVGKTFGVASASTTQEAKYSC